jgi:hypothetical protein
MRQQDLTEHVASDSFEKQTRPLRRLKNTYSRHKIQNLSRDTLPLKSIKLDLISGITDAVVTGPLSNNSNIF